MKEAWEEESVELEPSKLKGIAIGIFFALFIAIWLLAFLQIAGVVEVFRGGVGVWAEW